MKSKGRFKAFVKQFLGLTYTNTQKKAQSQVQDQMQDGQGVRLARVPFFVFHVLIYALTFFSLQIISTLIFNATGKAFTLSQFSFVLLVLLLSVIMLPVHIRRAHDIGWSMKHVLAWSIVPAVLRLVCLLIPLIVLLNQTLTAQLFGIMPIVGIVYWALMQIQLAFLVLLFFAPGTGHNRYGTYVARAFTLDNLYGIKIWNRKPKIDTRIDTKTEHSKADHSEPKTESKK